MRTFARYASLENEDCRSELLSRLSSAKLDRMRMAFKALYHVKNDDAWNSVDVAELLHCTYLMPTLTAAS